MAFFMGDDRLPQNRKVKQLTAPMLDADESGLAAMGLWTLAGCTSQSKGTDGLVDLADLVGIVYDRTRAHEIAGLLVDAGLWHEPGHDCPRCEPVPARHWRFHDWWAMRYKPAAVLRVAWAKSAEAKRPEIVNAVWWRDCLNPEDQRDKNRARCRYGCGRIVNRFDGASKDLDGRPQLDHVDPTKAAGVRNLVVACAGCNRKKASKTPADAGMTLTPPPRQDPDVPGAIDYTPPGTQQDATTALAGTTTATIPTTPTHASQDATTALAADAGVAGEIEALGKPGVEPRLEASSKSLSGRTHGRAHVQAPGSGSGSGLGLGQGEHHSGTTGKRRRRRRGRGGPAGPQAEVMDAGSAPLIPQIPVGGSPWATWSGPASEISSENQCPYHQLHLPCRRCAEDSNPGVAP